MTTADPPIAGQGQIWLCNWENRHFAGFGAQSPVERFGLDVLKAVHDSLWMGVSTESQP